MSSEKLQSYRFSTQAQWDSCLFDRAVREESNGKEGLRPLAPFTRAAARYESEGARVPVVTPPGEIIWCDDVGALHWLYQGETTAEPFPAPMGIKCASRVVATRSGIWAMGSFPGSIQKYEVPSMTRLLTVNLPNMEPIDIASNGQDSIWALVTLNNEWQVLRIDCAGHVVAIVDLAGRARAFAFTFLGATKRFVVLANDSHQTKLYWFSAQGGAAMFSLAVAAMHPCFSPIEIERPLPRHVLGSNSRDRVFLAGKDSDAFDGETFVMVCDADGKVIGEVPLDRLDALPTGLAATRDSLFVAGRRGLLQFDATEVVPMGIEPVQCTLITPALHSPDREDQRRWLRVEAMASLPEGSTIEISYAATDDVATRDRLQAIAANDLMSASQRVSTLLSEPDLWRGRTVFHGSDPKPEDLSLYSAKLFDVREPYLWICITLSAAAGVCLPRLSQLAVLYPGRTLMENLPSIYQREEARPDNFLRDLVGVLETTTQGLDSRIESMGRQIHPATAPERWLDFIARWLGVPWDDGLTPEQKRAVVKRAPDLAKSRGTCAGLEALLESLIPRTPWRFRVTDATADFGFAVVGGESCDGAKLPAMLGGHTPWNGALGSSAVLGYMRLPCEGQPDDGIWPLAGKVRVDVAATATERKAWEPWLLAVITEMVPVTARVELRWVTPLALRTNRLDGTMVLESAPTPHLGTDAIMSLARLPNEGTRLSAAGPIIGTDLR